MDEKVWMASKEVAEKLDVHVRTLRNWLEMFVPACERHKNPQGHYLISEKGFELLKEVKIRKDAGNSSLRDIQREMIDEGKLEIEWLQEDEYVAATSIDAQDHALAAVVQGQAMQHALHEVELTVQETLFQFKQELSNLSSMQQMQSTILQKIADIEEMQESLRLEMRRVTFEMDLMHQRMTRRKTRNDKYEQKWSLNPFRWFTRSNQSVTAE
ncbi:MerR family transcriptional regulator [Brevibacillus dissolubilis]|uniref:MerR family transcriptional regulator n=1 Tax=Brevibacillus dissolubilis TaxID=1844116 RepID=UPI00111770E5|nr:MerR family transcriptional regulator [Brevibacillus dissolubilis]